jgi:hypothetical protein
MKTVIPCGLTADGRIVLGGAFQLADTLGFPLWASMDEAENRGCVISIPHFFASAIEHGWDDSRAFGMIRDALSERGKLGDFEAIHNGCISMFMDAAKDFPIHEARAIARRMREMIEE